MALSGGVIQCLDGIATGEALILVRSRAASAIRLVALVHQEDVLIDSPGVDVAAEGDPHSRGIDGAIIDILFEVGGIGVGAAGIVGLVYKI